MPVFVKFDRKTSYRKAQCTTFNQIEILLDGKMLEDEKNNFMRHVYRGNSAFCHIRPTMEEDDERIIDWFKTEKEADESWHKTIESF